MNVETSVTTSFESLTEEKELKPESSPLTDENFIPETLGVSKKKKRRRRRKKKRKKIFRKLKPKNIYNFLKWKNLKLFLKKNILEISMLSAMLLAFVVGGCLRLRKNPYSELEIYLFTFPGKLFLRAMQGLLLPLVATSVITALGRLKESTSIRLVWTSLIYVMCTSVSAVFFSAILTITVYPGENVVYKKRPKVQFERRITIFDAIVSVLMNMIPENLIRACLYSDIVASEFSGTGINLTEISKEAAEKIFEKAEYWVFKRFTAVHPDVSGLVAVCIVVGIGLRILQKKGELMLDMIESINLVILQLTKWSLWYSAIGIFFVILADLMKPEVGNVFSNEMILYLLTFGLSLGVHAALVIPAIFYLVTRSDPWPQIKMLTKVLFISFATASSIVTMPTTLTCVEKDLQVQQSVARFLVPFGATLNADGAAIYIVVTSLFVCQVIDRKLGFGEIIILCINGLIQSLQVPPLPSNIPDTDPIRTGLLSINISREEYYEILEKIFIIDVFLNRFKTMLSVYGDAMGAVLLNQLRFVQQMPSQRQAICMSESGDLEVKEPEKDLELGVGRERKRPLMYWQKIKQNVFKDSHKVSQKAAPNDDTTGLSFNTPKSNETKLSSTVEVTDIEDESSSSSVPPHLLERRKSTWK